MTVNRLWKLNSADIVTPLEKNREFKIENLGSEGGFIKISCLSSSSFSSWQVPPSDRLLA